MTDAERIAQLEADILFLLYDEQAPWYDYEFHGWHCPHCDGQVPFKVQPEGPSTQDDRRWNIVHNEGCPYLDIESRHPFRSGG